MFPIDVSAIAALAARRRAPATNADAFQSSTPSNADGTPIVSSTNFFSPLRDSGDKSSSTRTPTKGISRSARQQRGSEPQATRPTNDASQDLNVETTSSSQTATQFSSFRPSKKNHRIKDGGVVELRLEESEVRSVSHSRNVHLLILAEISSPW